MFGLRDRVSRKLHRKSTCLLTNSPHVAAEDEQTVVTRVMSMNPCLVASR